MSEDKTNKPMTKVVNLKELVEPKAIAEAVLGIYVAQCIKARSVPDPKAFMGINYTNFASGVKKYEYSIEVEGTKPDWVVVDTATHKFVLNRDGSYTQVFNKTTGFNARMGRTVEDDPSWCPLGNEILDLEVSINGCPKVGGASCKFCYKNNTDKPATNMSLETFKKVVGKFPRNLSQIALGITGVQTNPDFVEMLRWLREDMGIIPNYTLSGADLNDEIFEATLKYCGRVAVSVYETDKNLCYNTIKRFNEKSPDFCNMHLILSDYNVKFVNEVLLSLARFRVCATSCSCVASPLVGQASSPAHCRWRPLTRLSQGARRLGLALDSTLAPVDWSQNTTRQGVGTTW